MEGDGGDSQTPLHCLHHLTRLHPQVPGGLPYRDRHPRGQAYPAGCGLEGGGTPCNLPVSAKGIR